MATQRVKTTIKTRQRKTGGNSGYEKCRMCGGSGRQKSPKKKK
jgi:hypothetical protein